MQSLLQGFLLAAMAFYLFVFFVFPILLPLLQSGRRSGSGYFLLRPVPVLLHARSLTSSYSYLIPLWRRIEDSNLCRISPGYGLAIRRITWLCQPSLLVLPERFELSTRWLRISNSDPWVTEAYNASPRTWTENPVIKSDVFYPWISETFSFPHLLFTQKAPTSLLILYFLNHRWT